MLRNEVRNVLLGNGLDQLLFVRVTQLGRRIEVKFETAKSNDCNMTYSRCGFLNSSNKKSLNFTYTIRQKVMMKELFTKKKLKDNIEPNNKTRCSIAQSSSLKNEQERKMGP